MHRLISLCSALAIAGVATAAPYGATEAQKPVPIQAFSSIQPGKWEFRGRGDVSANRTMCISDPGMLIQLKHGGAACSRYVIANNARDATVHYSCTGTGHGQTTIKVETPRLVQLTTQGVERNAPFAFEAEGRRIGDCNGGPGGGRR